MLKNVSAFAILLLIAGLWGCDSGSNTATSLAPEENTEEPTVEQGVAAPVQQAVPVQGEQYEIVVLNDSIKSPRKELRGAVDGVDLTVNYGSPAANGRTLWGGLVPFGKVSRTGANEAVKFTVAAPIMMGNKKIPAGTYGLFTLPEDEKNWYYIVNKIADQWGAYDYDESQDVARVKTTSLSSDTFSERMDFAIVDNQLQLHWGDLIIPIELAKAK